MTDIWTWDIILSVVITFALVLYYVFRKPYTVVCAQADFTGFIGRKSFKTYPEAINFAVDEMVYYDAVWIEMADGSIENVKGGV